MRIFRFILLCVLLGAISCTTETIEVFDDGYFYNCHLEQKWATADVKNHLLGKWRWIYKKMSWCRGWPELP